MKPGKELDGLIAEKIMGWKKLLLEPIPRGPHGIILDWMWDKKEGCFIHEVQVCPRYSTDIECAWFVVDNIDSPFSLERTDDSLFKASFGEKCNFIVAKTAAHAICLAALTYY